jgi:CRISPR/Cas system CSM-associated protein Csm4 (group 5 of RAMP superfamily)
LKELTKLKNKLKKIRVFRLKRRKSLKQNLKKAKMNQKKMVKGKTTNGLMRTLRDKHGINIGGSTHKKELLNMGYFHGYKGYRFIRNSGNRIPFTQFDELIAIY